MRQAPQTARLWGFFAYVMAMSLIPGSLIVRLAQAEDMTAWENTTTHTRERLHAMDAVINQQGDPGEAYENYMATFSPSVRAHGLLPGVVADHAAVREFYHGLFGTFEDSVLVSDELIVAGPMAAQRYHSLGYMTGTFDGVAMDRKLVAIRGQTFFRLDADGLIAERWSNHDHAYRLAQIKGESATEEGRQLAGLLNGPGLSEQSVYDRLASMAAAFNLIHDPDERETRFLAFFDKDVVVHGISAGQAGLGEFADYCRARWQALPDLVISLEAKLSAWSMGAVRWRATGSFRERYDDIELTQAPVTLTGETILRFNQAGKVVEIWINDSGLYEHTANHEKRNAYFGDLHVHTRLSVDAFAFGALGYPDDAYRYARGAPVKHASGRHIRIKTPLDFMAVTDHAEYLGVLNAMGDPASPLSKLQLARELYSKDKSMLASAVETFKASIFGNRALPELVGEDTLQTLWSDTIAAAERHYKPGTFTTFIAFEWSATPDGANLHRNVIFRGGAGTVPIRPLSAFDSINPEDLWEYMDQARRAGADVIAIPHNSNLSDGRMFPLYQSAGQLVDRDYAETRIRNEPLVELLQIKGSSETHPLISATDEWASFELLEELMGGSGRNGAVKGSYVRDAYRTGLQINNEIGINPYQFGLIGSSDSHNASVPVEEDNYSGKIGTGDATPESRRYGGSITSQNIKYSAAGLAGVWAEENTRESIFAALKRKEAFATSGPRIRIRMFAGWSFEDSILWRPDMIRTAYANGVAMGGNLHAAGSRTKIPRLLISAMRDPDSAPLQRLQVIKGWLADGETHERVFDVVCSDGLEPVNYRCPDNGATVDLDDCGHSADRGDVELAGVWTDPDFDAASSAFYYARVLENPTCRWSTWDALRMGWDLPSEVPAVIQERAWTSPVWYEPGKK
ncbi:MAG: DUF3604 domain-containing protein [Gammaproteobacteria bacterium]|nr:DUF3604 domain-containing protein [Gammaproteobacteria bacterium]